MANYFNLEIDNLWALNMPAVPVGATFSRVPSYFIPELLANQVSPADLAAYNAFFTGLYDAPPYPDMAAAFADMPALTIANANVLLQVNARLAEFGQPAETDLIPAVQDLNTQTENTALAFNTSLVGFDYLPAVSWATLAAQSANMATQNADVRKAGNDITNAVNGAAGVTLLVDVATNLDTALVDVNAAIAAAVDLRAITLGGAAPTNIVTSTTTMETATDQVTKFLDYIAGLAAPTNIVGPGVAYPNFAAFLVAQGVPL